MSDAEWKGKGSGDRLRGAEAKAKRDETLKRIYGTRVKIPGPGPERDEMRKAVQRVMDTSPMCDTAENVLRALEELEG